MGGGRTVKKNNAAMGRLKGIPAILSPDLLHALSSMGHGDEIVLADANFPTSSTCRAARSHSPADALGRLLLVAGQRDGRERFGRVERIERAGRVGALPSAANGGREAGHFPADDGALRLL